jgi:hypothetical protein
MVSKLDTVTDAELAAIERRWSIAASVVLGLALCGAALALAVVPWSEPLGGSNFSTGWPPFNHSYNSLESLVSYWWPMALVVLIAFGFIVTRLLRLPNGLIVIGACLLLVALALAVRPISAYPATKDTPGQGHCNAILGSGPFGDSDETCFDVRRARRFDIGFVGAAGFMVVGVGFAMRVGRSWSGDNKGRAEDGTGDARP